MIKLAEYSNMKICVAVSGGKDSMALLHYIYKHAGEYGITLSALNCDHKIRGEVSARDSAFVKEWCALHKIPLIFFEWNANSDKTEANARFWRLKCYLTARKNSENLNGLDIQPSAIYTADGKWRGADAIATAHHLNDNAETVLFNLARGSALSGLDGITDVKFPADDGWLNVIRPLIACSRDEIDGYVKENNIPFVEDETNFTDVYARNKIRRNVLPELEKAVPNAAKAIYRFSRLAAEDEQYFNDLIQKRKLISRTAFGEKIAFCEERVVFKRAAVKVIKEYFNKKDYTSEHAEILYNLQFAENGKKFGFLGLTAYKEDGAIVIDDDYLVYEAQEGRLFKEYFGLNGNKYCGQYFRVAEDESELREELEYIEKEADERFPEKVKTLRFDFEKIPKTAVIRFMKEGDKFTKFGGGTKSLGDYFTDKKIPVRIRTQIPLIADGNEILAVGGVEISDKIKITDKTKTLLYLVCADYSALK